MSNSIAASRRLARSVVVGQIVTTLTAAAVASLWGLEWMIAACFGGVVIFVPTAYFALAVTVRGAFVMPRSMPGVLFRAEATKLVLMALGFALGALWFGDRFLALILTSMACLAVNWGVLATGRKT